MTQRHELEPYVRDWLHGTLDVIPDPVHRYPVVAAEVNETPQQRPWLPQLSGRFQSMFTATKFVVAGAIVALFGGVLLSGVLTQQPSEESAPAVGASASTSPSPTIASEATLDAESDRIIVVAQDGSGDHTSVSEAVRDAAPGDTVLIRAGLYAEQVTVDKDITLRGELNAVIDGWGPPDAGPGPCPDAGTGWCAVWLRDTDASVVDLTLRGSPALLITAGAPTVQRVTSRDVFISDGSRASLHESRVGGVGVSGSGTEPVIERNEADSIASFDGARPSVRDNRAGRLHISSGGSGTFSDNVVTRLEGRDRQTGVAIEDAGEELVLRGNVIRGHDIGIDVQRTTRATFEENLIEGNRVGLRIDRIRDLVIADITYCDNRVDVRVRRGAGLGERIQSCTPVTTLEDLAAGVPVPGIGSAAGPTSVRPDLVPGVELVAEEVAAGVLCILHDGVRDVGWERDGPGGWGDAFVHHGLDGSVLVSFVPGSPCDEARCAGYRLGEPETFPLRHERLTYRTLDVGPDGTVWAQTFVQGAGAMDLRSWDGESWVVRRKRGHPNAGISSVAIGADGNVWATWSTARERQGERKTRLGRLTDDGWEILTSGEFGLVGASADGERIVFRRGDKLFELTEDGLTGLGDAAPSPLGRTMVAPNPAGVRWSADWGRINGEAADRLARHDGAAWEVYEVPAHLPPLEGIGVAPDGAVWWGADYEKPNGLARFDGEIWRHFLPGTAVHSFDFAPDGTVWASISEADGFTASLYVITPEAAVAAE